MDYYRKPDPAAWTGRISSNMHYLHEKVTCINLEESTTHVFAPKSFALLGYACDEGVKRNLGRTGAAKGPHALRQALGKMANHLEDKTQLADCGDIVCLQDNLEATQQTLTNAVATLLQHQAFPIVLGGGHDMAYAHYNGIRQFLSSRMKHNHVGIINLDAHFDLRTYTGMGTSGTPFYQIAQASDKGTFHYLCLGIQPPANIRPLFDTAGSLGVQYITNDLFTLRNIDNVLAHVTSFISNMDYLYLTVDLDGFSSAIAPGVSAPSPFGFGWGIAMETLKTICRSGKLISADIAELNPQYDIDQHTARLAAGIVVGLMGAL